MNFLYYLIPNLILLLLITTVTLVGSRKSWKVSLIKLVSSVALIVGTYFLSTLVISPAIFTAAVSSESLIVLMLGMPGITFSIMSLIVLSLFWLIFTLVSNSTEKKKFRSSRRTKRAITKKQTREEIRANRKTWRAAHKTSRAFGGIIAFVQGIVLSVVLMLGIGMISYDAIIIGALNEDETLVKIGTALEQSYNGSAVGLVDSLVYEEDGHIVLDSIYLSSIENISESFND